MKNHKKMFWIVGMIIVGCAIVVALVVNYPAEKQPHRGMAMEDLKKLFKKVETKDLGEVIIKSYREYRGNTVLWSLAYYGCLFGSAFFSASAALLLKLEILRSRPKCRNDFAAVFATLAALLITLSTTGDFQQKWQANRVAAMEMENLAYDLARESAEKNLEPILTRIQEINFKRNGGIVGDLIKGGAKESQEPRGQSQSDPPGNNQEDASGDAPNAERP